MSRDLMSWKLVWVLLTEMGLPVHPALLCALVPQQGDRDCHHAVPASLALPLGLVDLLCSHSRSSTWTDISFHCRTVTGLSHSPQRAPAASSASPGAFPAVFVHSGTDWDVLPCAAIVTEHEVHSTEHSLCCWGRSNRELSALRGIKRSCLELLVPNWTVNCFLEGGKIIYLMTKLNKFSRSLSETDKIILKWLTKEFFGSKTMISHWLSYLRGRRQATVFLSKSIITNLNQFLLLSCPQAIQLTQSFYISFSLWKQLYFSSITLHPLLIQGSWKTCSISTTLALTPCTKGPGTQQHFRKLIWCFHTGY